MPLSSKSTLALIVIASIFISAIFFTSIGYILGSRKAIQSTEPSATDQQEPKINLKEPKPIEESLNRFKNPTYGYSFAYPDGMAIDQKNETLSIYTSEDYSSVKRLEKEQAGTESPFPQIIIIYYDSYDDIENSSKYSSLENMLADKSIFRQTKKVDFAGVPAFQTIEAGMVDFYSYYIERNSNIYKIQAPFTEGESLNADQETILESFQFLEP